VICLTSGLELAAGFVVVPFVVGFVVAFFVVGLVVEGLVAEGFVVVPLYPFNVFLLFAVLLVLPVDPLLLLDVRLVVVSLGI